MAPSARRMPSVVGRGDNSRRMAYSQDLVKAARRHFEAAEQLYEERVRPRRQDVAGYLYGIAGECALKEMMRDSGMFPLEAHRDAYYAHFPALKTLLLDQARGRRAGQLLAFAQDVRLMAGWDVSMRYAPPKDIDPQLVERWREQARRLISAMEAQ